MCRVCRVYKIVLVEDQGGGCFCLLNAVILTAKVALCFINLLL